MIGGQIQVFLQHLNRLELQSHADKQGSLHKGESRHLISVQLDEVHFRQDGHQVHNQVEVDQVVRVGFEALQVVYGDVALDLGAREGCAFGGGTLCFRLASHELEGKRGVELAEVKAEELDHAALEIIGVERQPRCALGLAGECHFASTC